MCNCKKRNVHKPSENEMILNKLIWLVNNEYWSVMRNIIPTDIRASIEYIVGCKDMNIRNLLILNFKNKYNSELEAILNPKL